ncbi:MAG TPA: hypothetical protein VNM89_06235 [Solirubrobacterales bacterium]|nr:hypothetical protein [Solirubrobacterales bacterium]
MRRTFFVSFACALGLAVIGCGEEGVSSGATVNVYVSGESLCKGARQELNSSSGRAGSFHVRMICLDNPGTLAAAGANARRATEDSSTVGFLIEPDPTLASFSRSILDAADIAQVANRSGQASMATLLDAIRRADDPDSLRESVYSVLG